MKKFNYAFLRTPSQSAKNYILEGEVSLSQIINEHETFSHFLKNIPIRVHNLPSVTNDVIISKIGQLCLATSKCVIFSNFEENILNNQRIPLVAHFSRFYPLDRIHAIDFPGTFSSRDVLVVDNTFFVSLSQETNEEGAKQLAEILNKYGYEVVVIKDSQDSLQNYLNYIEGNNLLVKPGYDVPVEFNEFNQIFLSEDEVNGIGSLWINEFVIVPNNCLTLKESLISLERYRVLSITTDELNKLSTLLKEFVILF